MPAPHPLRSRPKRLIAGVVVSALLAAASACVTPRCGPGNCPPGCCDAEGSCPPGVSEAACAPRDGGAASALDLPRSPPAPSADERLANFLTGQWDTAEQALVDSRFYDIHLSICPAAAPELGSRVLYVEQAMASTLQAPYRQRLYVVEPVPDGLSTAARSRVFELANPAAAIGACARATPPAFGAADAVERPGCTVTLSWDERTQAFSGGTNGRDCLSSLRGATYATTEVLLDRTRLDSLDRGWSASDAQVWGSTFGPYLFVRKSPAPP